MKDAGVKSIHLEWNWDTESADGLTWKQSLVRIFRDKLAVMLFLLLLLYTLYRYN